MATPARRHQEAAEWLTGRGLSVDPHRLMLWDHAGLWPPEHVTEETREAIFRRVSEVHGRGGSVEHTTLTLAGEGLGCEALRNVLRNRLSIDLPADEPGTGMGASTAEQLGAGLDEAVDDAIAATSELWRSLRARVRNSESSVTGESSELVWQSFMVDLFEAILDAGAPFEPETLGVAFGALDGDVDVGWSVLRAGRDLHVTARRIIETTPIDGLATVVMGWRPVVAWLDQRNGEPRLDDDAVTLMAALVTPYMLAATVSSAVGPLMARCFGFGDSEVTELPGTT